MSNEIRSATNSQNRAEHGLAELFDTVTAITLGPVDLVSCELLQRHDGDDDADSMDDGSAKESLYFYNVSIHEPRIVNEFFVAFCELKAGEIISDVSKVEFNATYFYSFTGVSEDITQEHRNLLLDHVARMAVWPRFRDLFAFTMAQADLELPALPVSPQDIDKKSLSDVDEDKPESHEGLPGDTAN